jgi:cellulose synthase/poly-beta-1,6-N-acetylglucosamine synthase-like glycosyltransferase
MLLTALALGGTAFTLPGTLELASLTVGAFLPRRPRPEGVRTIRHLAIVVPAHDEEGSIAACVRGLLACDPVDARVTVHVIADNCTDRTADRARSAGAEVIVRNDLERRGKGYALEHAFSTLLRAEPDLDAVVVVDADTRVQPNFLQVFTTAFAGGAEAVQCRYQIGNPEASERIRLVAIAFKAFNVLRPRGRSRLGLSAGILGNGFGLSRRVVERVPYTARSVVEDLEYHLELVRRGYRVEFLEDTEVVADQPLGDRPTETQRARWEGGRLRMMRENVPRLVREVASGRLALLEPLGELVLLPLALHVGTLGVVLLIPFPPTQVLAGVGLGVVAAHIAAALIVGDGGLEDVLALARAPKYVGWKLAMLPRVFGAARKEQAWVRTERDQQPPEATPTN